MEGVWGNQIVSLALMYIRVDSMTTVQTDQEKTQAAVRKVDLLPGKVLELRKNRVLSREETDETTTGKGLMNPVEVINTGIVLYFF